MTDDTNGKTTRGGKSQTGKGSLTASGLVPIEIIREEMKRAVVVRPWVPSVSEVLAARRRGRTR